MKRIYHTWDEWECYPAGFYETRAPGGMDDEAAREAYREFLVDLPRFRAASLRLLDEWPNSCEHYLSNERMNRIAWIGQASMCLATGIPSRYRGGFMALTDEQQHAANLVALDALNEWMTRRGEPTLTLAEAASKTEMDLY